MASEPRWGSAAVAGEFCGCGGGHSAHAPGMQSLELAVSGLRRLSRLWAASPGWPSETSGCALCLGRVGPGVRGLSLVFGLIGQLQKT